jgi:hypothetical protein
MAAIMQIHKVSVGCFALGSHIQSIDSSRRVEYDPIATAMYQLSPETLSS